MDLEGDKTIGSPNFIIFEVNHLVVVQPGGNLAAHYFYPELIPFALL